MDYKEAWRVFEKTGKIDDYLSYIGVHTNSETLLVKDGSDADKDTGICPKAAEYR